MVGGVFMANLDSSSILSAASSGSSAAVSSGSSKDSLAPLQLKRQLARLIRERGLTGAELARRSGIPKQSISDWLAGVRPRNISQVKKIADTLGIGLTELCFGPENAELPKLADPLAGYTSAPRSVSQSNANWLDSVIDLIFGHTEELMVFCDSKGIIRKVSRRWAELLGWSQSELLGMNAMGLVHPDDQERIRELARNHPTTEPGGPSGIVIRVNDRSGRYLKVRHHFRVLGTLGGIPGGAPGPVLAFSQVTTE